MFIQIWNLNCISQGRKREHFSDYKWLMVEFSLAQESVFDSHCLQFHRGPLS